MANIEIWQQSIDNTYCKSFFSQDRKYVYVGQTHSKSFLGFKFLRLDAETGKTADKYPLKGGLGSALETEDRLYLTTEKKCRILDKETLKPIQVYQKGITKYTDQIATDGKWLLTTNYRGKTVSCLNLQTGEQFKKKAEKVNGMWAVENHKFYIATNTELLELDTSSKNIKSIYSIDIQKVSSQFNVGMYYDFDNQTFYYLGTPFGTLYISDLKNKVEQSIYLDTCIEHKIFPHQNKLFVGGSEMKPSTIFEIDLKKMNFTTFKIEPNFILKAIDPTSRRAIVYKQDESNPVLKCIAF